VTASPKAGTQKLFGKISETWEVVPMLRKQFMQRVACPESIGQAASDNLEEHASN
jgi:hypothetical protein